MREHHGSSCSAGNEWLFRHEKDDALQRLTWSHKAWLWRLNNKVDPLTAAKKLLYSSSESVVDRLRSGQWHLGQRLFFAVVSHQIWLCLTVGAKWKDDKSVSISLMSSQTEGKWVLLYLNVNAEVTGFPQPPSSSFSLFFFFSFCISAGILMSLLLLTFTWGIYGNRRHGRLTHIHTHTHTTGLQSSWSYLRCSASGVACWEMSNKQLTAPDGGLGCQRPYSCSTSCLGGVKLGFVLCQVVYIFDSQVV